MTRTKVAPFLRLERLKSAPEFRALLTKGRVIREEGIALYFLGRQPGGASRLGILISRRAMKRAVWRNTAKRQVREFFRLNKGGFSGSFDVVVRILDMRASRERGVLRGTLKKLFERAGILERGRCKEKVLVS